MFRIFLRLTFDSFRLRRLFPFVLDKLRNRETSKDLPPFLNRMWVKISFDSEFIAWEKQVKNLGGFQMLQKRRIGRFAVAPRSDSESDEGMFGCTKMRLGNFWRFSPCV